MDLSRIDSVYFLLRPGWDHELRANRWHFATRWARLKPVMLVNPVLDRGPAVSDAEPRIPNCRVLRIHASGATRHPGARQTQLDEVLADMKQHRFARPLVWSYNPNLVHVDAGVPAAARVYHATEAYFDMPAMGAVFHDRLRAMVTISDVSIAVSEGVASGLRAHVPGAQVVTVTNGCDYAAYSAGKPDAALRELGVGFDRIAIYGGNINSRLDFSLVERLARQHTRDLFAFYGPVKGLDRATSRMWQRVLALPNVRSNGPVDPDRLPDLYAAADVGVIPYRQDPFLVENGLPLKALEMCATGLPVVSSLMKPLLHLTAGVAVTSSAEEFLAAYSVTSRARLSPAQLAEMRAVSSANDYDVKFADVLRVVGEHIPDGEPTTRADRVDLPTGSGWLARPLASRTLGGALRVVAWIVPPPIRRRIRASKRVRELLGS